MEIQIQIDNTCTEPKIIILTARITDDINALVQRLSDEPPQMLAGFRGDACKVLEPAEILRVYASGGKVYAQTQDGEYLLRQRLYELEKRLDRSGFVRISNSEIIHLKKVKRFDLSPAGTICVLLSDGTVTYASRRYVSRIKKILGV